MKPSMNTEFSPEELARRRTSTSGRWLAWSLGVAALAIYLAGIFLLPH